MARSSFIADISHTDHMRLRAVVKQVAMRHLKKHQITDREADKIIEQVGWRTFAAMLKRATDGLPVNGVKVRFD